jgi:hypothetical protein
MSLRAQSSSSWLALMPDLREDTIVGSARGAEVEVEFEVALELGVALLVLPLVLVHPSK